MDASADSWKDGSGQFASSPLVACFIPAAQPYLSIDLILRRLP